MASLAAVILNWNGLEATRERVRELLGWRDLVPEVWVVDNGSDGAEATALAAEFPAARVLAAPANLGFGGGNNLALRRTGAAYALLLNNDAGLAEADGRRLLALLEARADLAVAGPLITDRGDPSRIQAAGGRDIARHARTNLRPGDLPAAWLAGAAPYPVDYVPGTAVMLRLEAVRAADWLDERYFFGGEMADLCRRLRRQGWGCAVLPTARAWHDRNGRSPSRQALDAYYTLRNRFLYLEDHAQARGRARRRGWIAYGVAAVGRDLLVGRPALARARLAALRDGLAGRFGGWASR
jgi:hypothetical protein